jgi:hypothetical protein
MRSSRTIRLVCVTLLVALACSATVALAAQRSTTSGVAGTWSGKYSGAFSGTFTLHWRLAGSTLRGSIALSYPKGTYGITGSVHRGAIKFGVVAAGATYTGAVFGSKMSGTYKSPRGTGKWSAHKVS